MNRHNANSTAIAALLALGLATQGQAEITLSVSDAESQGLERADEMPQLDKLLQEELLAGLDEPHLSCLDGAARPCADQVPLVTPAGVSVQLIEGGGMVLAPSDMQPYFIREGQPELRNNELDPLASERLEQARANLATLRDGGMGTPLGAAAPVETAAAEQPSADEAVTEEPGGTPMEPVAEDSPSPEEAAAIAAERNSQEPMPEEEMEDGSAPAEQAGDQAQQSQDELAEQLQEAREAEMAGTVAAEQPSADAASTEEPDDTPMEPVSDDAPSPEEAATIAAERNSQEPMPEETQEGSPPADQAADQAQRRQNELAQQLQQAREAEMAGAGEAGQQVETRDSHAARERRVPGSEADALQQRRSGNMPELAAMLNREIEGGLTADDLICADGSDRPCAQGVALVSPSGIAADVTEDGRVIMAAAGEQQFIVGDNGQLRARGSNAAAAKEAAEAAAPTAEALNSDAEGETVSETVKQARSSAEDFETTIADAYERAAAQQEVAASASDDDDGNDTARDLARVALAGLGALAVGQVLNGNREVALNTGDRVIVTRADGSQQVLKDDNALLRQSGNEVQTENFSDGSSRSVVTRPDQSRIITIRAADLTVLRRVHVAADGTETVLIDESVEVPPVELSELPEPPAPRPDAATPTTEEALREALAREAAISRKFSLNQVRSIPEVRNLVAPVDIDAITFETNSAAINPDQARQLATLGTVLEEAIADNPREIFLIEGHTDAVGAATFNLALSDRRAETVALALSEYFDVPPENLVVQGYGEEYLKVPTLLDERENRRASVRRITDLLASAN